MEIKIVNIFLALSLIINILLFLGIMSLSIDYQKQLDYSDELLDEWHEMTIIAKQSIYIADSLVYDFELEDGWEERIEREHWERYE